MDEHENPDDDEDKDVQHDKLNQVDANESEINKISLALQDDWREFDNYLKLNNLELYDSMRFNIDESFLNDDNVTKENQLK